MIRLKPADLEHTSGTQKKTMKKKKQKEVMAKLSGKNYSPIVAAAKTSKMLFKKKDKSSVANEDTITSKINKKIDKPVKETINAPLKSKNKEGSTLKRKIKEVAQRPPAKKKLKSGEKLKKNVISVLTESIPEDNVFSKSKSKRTKELKPVPKKVKIASPKASKIKIMKVKEKSKLVSEKPVSRKEVEETMKDGEADVQPPKRLKPIRKKTSGDAEAKVKPTLKKKNGSLKQASKVSSERIRSLLKETAGDAEPEVKPPLKKKGTVKGVSNVSSVRIRTRLKKTDGDSEAEVKPPLKKKDSEKQLPNSYDKSARSPKTSAGVKGVKPSKKQKGLKLVSKINPPKKISLLKARSLRRRPVNRQRGVVVFKNIPHGFYEKELKKYCSQFGTVTNVYHPVSKRGNSKGYAFVEFAHKDVAKVVAETMDNYVMFYKRMRCEMVDKERERPWVFRHEKSKAELAKESREAALKQRMRHLSKDEVTAWKKRKQSRINVLHKKLSSMGVDYEFQVEDGSRTPAGPVS